VSPVRYDLGFYIPEDRRQNLKYYVTDIKLWLPKTYSGLGAMLQTGRSRVRDPMN
jgi:hypothetical protein